MASTPANTAAPRTANRRGPLGLLLDLFSSVRLGIVLLAILFVYMSIGSAGVLYPTHPNIFDSDAWAYAQLRQWRPFELTEFEWFHWWVFDTLMLLLSANIVVTTLRRIPLKPVNYGVWGIHSGVLIMIAGCWLYFGTKIEGDALVARRRIVAEVVIPGPDGKPTVLDRVEAVARPGQRISVGTQDRAYQLSISSIDPDWPVPSAAASGTTAYAVNVQVQPTSGPAFTRQLVAGHPEQTKDVLPGAPGQPAGRAAAETGQPLVDESLRISLDYAPQQWLYRRTDMEKVFALYVRPAGTREWTMRPIEGMPLYNDYVGSLSEVFQAPGETPLPVDPIDLLVPPVEGDPFPDVTLRISGYLRYATERSRMIPGAPDGPLYPVAWISVGSPQGGQANEFTLEALDPQRRDGGGFLGFRFAGTERAFEALLTPPTLTFRVPSKGIDVQVLASEAVSAERDAPFRPLGEASGYAYRVMQVERNLMLSTGLTRVAFVDLKTPKGEFRRWVFEDGRMTRDVNEELLKGDMSHQRVLLDDTIEVEYSDGHGDMPLTLVAGPDPNQLRLITAMGSATGTATPMAVGKPFTLPAGIAVTVTDYMPRAIRETKPFVVPPSQRNRDAGTQFALAKLDVPGVGSAWLPFHLFAYESPRDTPRGVRYQPDLVRLPDGRSLEVMFGRQRLPLPAPVVLEEFVLATHIGGFTGQVSTIRDYRSMVRFGEPDGGWTEPAQVSVNNPVENNGYSYFQSQWDPPDPPQFEGDIGSAGLNHTVLGVGNRHGVWTMLIGTIVACLGMIYAFYVKPLIKRRQREVVFASAASRPASAAASLSVEKTS